MRITGAGIATTIPITTITGTAIAVATRLDITTIGATIIGGNHAAMTMARAL